MVTANVESRFVWGSLIVRSFAEIIQHPLGSFGVPKLCEVARPAKKKSEKKLEEQISLICFEMHGKQ